MASLAVSQSQDLPRHAHVSSMTALLALPLPLLMDLSPAVFYPAHSLSPPPQSLHYQIYQVYLPTVFLLRLAPRLKTVKGSPRIKS